MDTIFDMASLTKIMPTAVSIMILVEEGRLSLSDPVSKHLNRFSQYGKHRVTVRQLLTHYSGLRPSLSLKTHGPDTRRPSPGPAGKNCVPLPERVSNTATSITWFSASWCGSSRETIWTRSHGNGSSSRWA